MIDIFNEPCLVEIAKKHKKTVAQVVLNYMWFGLNAIVIPKTEKNERLKENFEWHDFTLDKSDLD